MKVGLSKRVLKKFKILIEVVNDFYFVEIILGLVAGIALTKVLLTTYIGDSLNVGYKIEDPQIELSHEQEINRIKEDISLRKEAREKKDIELQKKIKLNQKKIYRLNGDVDYHLEHLVHERISIWKKKGGIKNVKRWIDKVSKYNHHINYCANERSINPNYFKALIAAESAVDKNAQSIKSAAGLVQLMPNIAKSLGLRVDTYTDERLNPRKSIKAACKLIDQQNKIKPKYTFTMTARYNYGTGNLSKLVEMYGEHGNLFYKLPEETKEHYVKIMSVKQVIENSDKYSL